MDAEERLRMRELVADAPEWALPMVTNADVLALFDALDAAQAEATRYREALVAIEDTIENVRFEQRSGHIIIVDIEESITDIVRVALAATEPEAG